MHLRPDETIIEKYRHHPFPFFLQMLLMGFASVILFAGIVLFFPDVSSDILFTVRLVLAILLLLFIAHLVLVYWGDALILTNYRLISVDWKFFHWQTEEELGLHSVKEVETSDNGLLRYIPLFDYGIVRVFSEGKGEISFSQAPSPDKIKHAILTYVPNTNA